MQEMEQVISARAYALWEEEGRPDGRALAHWLAAAALRRRGFKPEG